MSDRQVPRHFDTIAPKWRDLARRRRDHFIELYRSGRWKHYYTEDELVRQVRQATQVLEAWDEIVRSAAAPLTRHQDAA